MERKTASDVGALLESIDLPGFPYRELAQEERHRAAASRWSLLSSANRALALLSRAADNQVPRVTRHRRRTSSSSRSTVALVSLCGGTGRTTIAAHLAQALGHVGRRALAVELDSQGSLALHFGVDSARPVGLVSAQTSAQEVAAALQQQRGGAMCLPFGSCTEEELAEADARIARDPEWLRLRLDAYAPEDVDLVILDVPARRNPWLRQALAVADQVIVVLGADPLSYATLPATEALLLELLGDGAGRHDAVYLINRFDGTSELDRDVVSAMRGALRERVLPFVIQRDLAVPEALARRVSVLQHAPDSQVVADFSQLADWTSARAERFAAEHRLEAVSGAR